MRRRAFLTGLAGAATVPVVARSQQSGRVPTIGFLSPNAAAAQREWTDAFVQRLRELGWIEGSTIAIEYRFAEGRSERLAEMAAELVQLKVNVLATSGQAAAAAKQETSTIPIVFELVADPLGTRLVASLARPGGNVTGLSMQNTDLAPKRVELLREIVPGLRRLAIMANIGNSGSVLELDEVRTTARRFGYETTTLELRSAEDIVPAFRRLKGIADALYVCGDPLITSNRARITALALEARTPAMFNFCAHALAGGLVSYGANQANLFRRAAEIVDRILRGAKPSDIPVEQPTKFDLVINLKTAKELGLTVPATVLARADEVIE